MTDAARPEVVVIGDSHVIALKQGCDALGVPAGMLSASGNYWHRNLVAFDAESGIAVPGARGLAGQAEAIRRRLGGAPVLSGDLPVVVSAGFNLGRLVPKLRSERNVASAAFFDGDAAALFLSGGFIRRYVQHYRAPQIRVLKQMSRMAPVTVVPPPLASDDSVAWAVYRTICDMVRAAKLDLYEPMAELGALGRGLDETWFEADGSHGNQRYGRAVIEGLIARGAFGAAAPRQKGAPAA